MDKRSTLVNMLGQLLKEIELVTSQGAGYYTCAPFAKRYNKLLGQAATLFPDDNGIVNTFEQMPASDPKDPSDKGKFLQEIRVETTQLISLLESTREEGSAP
jgi:hypothetical protein